MSVKSAGFNAHRPQFSGQKQDLRDALSKLPAPTKDQFEKAEEAGERWCIANASQADDFFSMVRESVKLLKDPGQPKPDRDLSTRLWAYMQQAGEAIGKGMPTSVDELITGLRALAKKSDEA